MEQIVPEQSTESSIIGTELEILYQDEDFVAINFEPRFRFSNKFQIIYDFLINDF